MADADGVMSRLKSMGTSAKEMLLSSKDGKNKFSIGNSSLNSSNLLIKAPVITVIICLIVTGFSLVTLE